MSTPHHYVCNASLTADLSNWIKTRKEAIDQDKPIPQLSNYVGECILLIAKRLAYKPNFNSYTFRDDLIADGVEACVKYLHNFNPEKSNNAFAYITQILHNAMVRCIERESKYTYTKAKLLQARQGSDLVLQGGDVEEYDRGKATMADKMFQDAYGSIIDKYETKTKAKRERAKKKAA